VQQCSRRADSGAALLCPGTGKTVYVKDVLEGLDKGRFATIQTAFSARTSANQTQVSRARMLLLPHPPSLCPLTPHT
jgi:hypothetical protein